MEFDAKNCRSCGHGCPGTTCDNSSCTNTCAQGFIDCNKNVADGCEVNSAADPKNCGNCGIACGAQMVCVGGECRCPKGTADCDGQKDNGCETDISSNSASCGQCFKACGAGQHCVNSACTCQVGFGDCNLAPEDGCEASLTGDHSCGSCALDCQQHSKCVAAGDCASMDAHPRPKSGVYAVRAGKPLARNLRRALAGAPLVRFVPQPQALYLLATGPRHAIAAWRGFSAEGNWVWHWKDHIDRRFMERYPRPAPAGP